MGKNDFLTPKAIANRMKSKGLQKLRWYCQMCQKQCRDENGFKCHQESDSHKRQMEVFGQNPERVIDGYSEEFLSDFMEHLRRSHPSSRVSAKGVYNEFIANKNHIHMNSTKWYTLTEFVKYLGKEGLCRVDETPKGWFISVIQQDPFKDIQEEKRVKRDRAERDEEDRKAREIEAQIERAKKYAKTEEHPTEGSELQRDESGAPLKLSLPSKSRFAPAAREQTKPLPSSSFANDSQVAENQTSSKVEHKKSKLEELMEMDKVHQKYRKDKEQRDATTHTAGPSRQGAWLQEGIVVKVMSKALKDQGYYKQKGVVKKVIGKFVAQLSMLDSGDVLQVDQEELETVIPSVGGSVLVLLGPHKGCQAVLESVDTANFKARLTLKEGALNKQVDLEYEQFSKLR